MTANVTALRELTRGELMAVLKADGYGHGIIPSARAALAGGASWLGVADPAEALALRQAGIDAPTVCLMGVGTAQQLIDQVAAGVDLTAGSAAFIAEVAVAADVAGAPARLQLRGRRRTRPGRRHAPRTGRRRSRRPWPRRNAGSCGSPACGRTSPAPTSPVTRRYPRSLRCRRCGGVRGEGGTDARGPAYRQHGRRPDPAGSHVRPGTGRRRTTAVHVARRGAVMAQPAMTLSAGLALVERVPAGTASPMATGAPRTGSHASRGTARLWGRVPRAVSGHALVSARGRRSPIVGTDVLDQFVVDFGDDLSRPETTWRCSGPATTASRPLRSGAGAEHHLLRVVTGIGAGYQELCRRPSGGRDDCQPAGTARTTWRRVYLVALAATATEMRDFGRRLAGLLAPVTC